MRLNRLAMTVRLAAASFAMLPALNATSGQASVDVLVRVQLISSSGVCGLLTGAAAVGVTCGGGSTVSNLVAPVVAVLPVVPVLPIAPPPWVTPGPQMPPNDGLGGQLPIMPPTVTPAPTPPGAGGPPVPFPGIALAAAPQAVEPSSRVSLQGLVGFNQPSDLRYVGRVAYPGEGFSLYSASAEITSWRIVSLDNGKYVELTIAW